MVARQLVMVFLDRGVGLVWIILKMQLAGVSYDLLPNHLIL